MGGDRPARRTSRASGQPGLARRLARSRPLVVLVIAAVVVGNALTRSGGSDALFLAGAGLTLLGGGGAVALLVLWLIDRFDHAHPPGGSGARPRE